MTSQSCAAFMCNMGNAVHNFSNCFLVSFPSINVSSSALCYECDDIVGNTAFANLLQAIDDFVQTERECECECV